MGLDYKCGCRLSGNEFYLCDVHKQFMFNVLEVKEQVVKLEELDLREQKELLSQIKDTKYINYDLYCYLKSSEEKVKKSIQKENKRIFLM